MPAPRPSTTPPPSSTLSHSRVPPVNIPRSPHRMVILHLIEIREQSAHQSHDGAVLLRNRRRPYVEQTERELWVSYYIVEGHQRRDRCHSIDLDGETVEIPALGGGGAVGYYLFHDASEVGRSPGLVRAVGIRLGTSAAVDIVIAVSMTFVLLRSRAQALGHTNSILTRLVRLTVETGTITAIAAIVDLVFFIKAHNGLHQVSGVILGKMYSNTLLVLLNNRLAMRREPQLHVGESFRAGMRSRAPGTNDSEPATEIDLVDLGAKKFSGDLQLA
ncbi:hypothetical protein FB45DRAFT_1112153 [Roridomyces roridus]|uniref:DUF6534 domain-containing protein n=1 Tax=Roridomyces roridus TaxID=1738132 RepID=A0AAD7B858_9AGAR|nr:hypothetical protein FB45DRAFT_1112153 [Roridomyces roridus]